MFPDFDKGKPIVRWGRKVMDLCIECVAVDRSPDRRKFLFSVVLLLKGGGRFENLIESTCTRYRFKLSEEM
jgi:hypothetical protein